MSPEQSIVEELGGWQGYRTGSVGRFAKDQRHGEEEIWVELHPLGEACCSGCGQAVGTVHETTERWVRDLPAWGAQTWLLLHQRRVKCPRCGVRVERIEWLAPYARVTKRLAQSVARLCQELPIRQVSAYYALQWDVVKTIHKRALQEKLEPADLSGIETIVMDEFAIQKGHRYATTIIEPSSRRVLWVGRGRTRDAVRPFFQLLGAEGCGRLRAAAMDMNGPYELEVRAQCPQAQIVYDLFHVVAKYGRDVIDRVRIEQANRLRHDKPSRQIIKGARWLLLRNAENLRSDEERLKLSELLQANHQLMTVYVLKDDLKQLWQFKSMREARHFWRDWYHRAIHSRIEPLKLFARRLKPYLPGILAHCRWPLNTSVLEGINNKIKVIKRMAYGFRDDLYFFLRIREAFPGNTG